MSVTAVGPALGIDGPLPVARPHGLLTLPGVLRERDGHWLTGVNVYGYPDDVPEPWEPCSSGTYRTKDDGSAPPQPRFDAVGLYVAISCSAGYMGDWREFARRAELVLDATLSHGVEEVLSFGVTGSTNPFFGDTNVAVLASGTAQTADAALRHLELAIGVTGRQGVIHAPPPVIAAWSDSLRVVDGTLYTYNGTPVAAGSGYLGAPVNGNVPIGTTSYAFATGPVQVSTSETTLVGDDINGSLDTSNNDVTFRAERFVLADWDTALQAAVLVDWTCDAQCSELII